MTQSRLCLMAIFAHPDDEAFGPAGTIAKYTAQGVKVALLTVTRGEAGMTGGLPISGSAELGKVREKELQCTCRALGIDPCHIVGYPDGDVAHADANELEGQMVAFIREQRPQVIVTFGPDGISRHPDHMAVSRLATAAFLSASDAARFPEQLQRGLSPHRPSKLYYVALPRSLVERFGMELASTPDESISAVIDISAEIGTKVAALKCHRTQAADYNSFLEMGLEQHHMNKEYYVLHRSTLSRPRGEEDDLFAGLR